MKKMAVIGLGLIGGSLSLDMKRLFPEVRRVGFDANPEHLRLAQENGLIDSPATESDLMDADWVVVAVPVNVACGLLESLLHSVGENTLVLDVGSTKADICHMIKKHPRRANFLATHPIAGTEFSGPSAAIHSLFQGKTQMICEADQTREDLLTAALQVFARLGMRVAYMTPEEHDKHIAYVSHLSHISSFMLGKTVLEIEKSEKNIFDMAGSGFGSTVRLAKSSPAMWTPIFIQNKNNVLTALDEYIDNLKTFRNKIETENYEALYRDMEDTNHIKQILKGIYNEE
jgi:prephenate dehydrogenase